MKIEGWKSASYEMIVFSPQPKRSFTWITYENCRCNRCLCHESVCFDVCHQRKLCVCYRDFLRGMSKGEGKWTFLLYVRSEVGGAVSLGLLWMWFDYEDIISCLRFLTKTVIFFLFLLIVILNVLLCIESRYAEGVFYSGRIAFYCIMEVRIEELLSWILDQIGCVLPWLDGGWSLSRTGILI